MRDIITQEILEKLPEGNSVISPMGVWSLFSMSAYSIPEVLSYLELNEEEAWKQLEQYTAEAQASDEISMNNYIWGKNQSFISNIPKSAWINISDSLPSQEEADNIVRQDTQGLIDSFPTMVDGSDLILTNILTMLFDWKQKFKTIENKLPHWNTQEILSERNLQKKDGEVRFILHNDNLYAAFIKYSHQSSEVVSLISTNENPRKKDTLDALQHYIAGTAEEISWAEAMERGGDNFTIVKSVGQGDGYDVSIPAWEFSHTTNLNDIFTLPDRIEGGQEAVVKYQTEGFSAAAISFFVTRTAAMVIESYYLELSFDKPFASAAFFQEGQWKGIPAFIAWTETAVEPDKGIEEPF